MITVSVIWSFLHIPTQCEVNLVENKVHLDSIARSGDKKTKPVPHERGKEAAIEKSLSPLEGDIKERVELGKKERGIGGWGCRGWGFVRFLLLG